MTPLDANKRSLLLAGAALALGTAAYAAGQAKPRVIKIVAKKFEFVPAEIRLKRGEAVTLQFTAPEVPMGVNLADFKLRADVVPGKTAVIEFTPDKVGTFIFLCDVFCGSGHEDMSGTLVVS